LCRAGGAIARGKNDGLAAALWVHQQNLGILEPFVAKYMACPVSILCGAFLGFISVYFLLFVACVYWSVIKWVMAEIRKNRH
jgi:hypothetical protein